MAIRMIITDLWQDQVWRREVKDIKLRYFWLYLLTCTMSKTCGIFHLPLDLVSMETRLSLEDVETCIQKLSDLKLCVYSNETEEIAISNYPKYNIRNMGKPMVDCIIKELELVKDKELMKVLIDNLNKYQKTLTDINKQQCIHTLIEIYISSYKGETYYKGKELDNNYSNNTNTNTNSDRSNDTLHDTLNQTNDMDTFLKEIGYGNK